MYISTTKKSNSEVILLELTIRPQWSEQMKLMKLSDLTSLRVWLMLAIYSPKEFMKVDILSLLIETIICLCKDPLVVMLI